MSISKNVETDYIISGDEKGGYLGTQHQLDLISGDEKGGYLGTQHQLDHGHKRIH
jgi:DNA-binding LacI/PurR family transcriptional regulator